MEDNFQIDVIYKGEPCTYDLRLVRFGYTYGFHMIMDHQVIQFEPDEEGSSRAYLLPSEISNKAIDPPSRKSNLLAVRANSIFRFVNAVLYGCATVSLRREEYEQLKSASDADSHNLFQVSYRLEYLQGGILMSNCRTSSVRVYIS